MSERMGFRKKFYIGTFVTAVGFSVATAAAARVFDGRLDCTKPTKWFDNYNVCEGEGSFWVFDDRQNGHHVEGKFSNVIEVRDWLLVGFTKDGSYQFVFIRGGEEVARVDGMRSFEEIDETIRS